MYNTNFVKMSDLIAERPRENLSVTLIVVVVYPRVLVADDAQKHALRPALTEHVYEIIVVLPERVYEPAGQADSIESGVVNHAVFNFEPFFISRHVILLRQFVCRPARREPYPRRAHPLSLLFMLSGCRKFLHKKNAHGFPWAEK